MDIIPWQQKKLAELHARAPVKRKKPKRFAQIPYEWCKALVGASGQEWHLAWHIRFYAFKHAGRPFKLPNGALEKAGLPRETKRRGLQRFEKLGLILVERTNGKSPVVTIL